MKLAMLGRLVLFIIVVPYMLIALGVAAMYGAAGELWYADIKPAWKRFRA